MTTAFRGGTGDVFFTLLRVGVSREVARKFVSSENSLASELRRLIRDASTMKPAEFAAAWKSVFTRAQCKKIQAELPELKRAWLMMRFNSPRTRKEYGAIRRMAAFEIETIFDVDAFYVLNFHEFNQTPLLELERTFDELQHRNKSAAKQYGLTIRQLSSLQTSSTSKKRGAGGCSGGISEDAMYDALRAAGSGRDFIRESNLNEYVPYEERYKSHPAHREEDDEFEDCCCPAIPISELMRRLSTTESSAAPHAKKRRRRSNKKKRDVENEEAAEEEEEEEDENREAREMRRLAECYSRHRNSFLLENGRFYSREAVRIEKDLAKWAIGMFAEVVVVDDGNGKIDEE